MNICKEAINAITAGVKRGDHVQVLGEIDLHPFILNQLEQAGIYLISDLVHLTETRLYCILDESYARLERVQVILNKYHTIPARCL